MACPSCARPVPEGARFCPSCGAGLSATATTEERRVVTVLFADLVGFTALAEHRDPEQVKRFVDAVFQRLAVDVESFGGRVDKVLGDAIVALFGAPVAHEDDAERAVRTGLRMHDTLARVVVGQLDGKQDEVRLRIGINTGEVLVGTLAGTDYTAMGDVVNTASRLQSMAPAGGVLVGDATKALCSEAIRFSALEPARLRGRQQVEQVWLVEGIEGMAGRRRRRPDVDFVGREVERSLLDGVTRFVAAGNSAIVSIVGEAGIGKSRFVDEALAAFVAHSGDVALVDGTCSPYGEPNIWWPLASGIGRRLGIDRTQTAEQVRSIITGRSADLYGAAPPSSEVRKETEALVHLLGHPSDLDRLDATATRDAIFAAVIAGVRRRAVRGPVVLWVDDIQWSSPVLRELFEVLARSLADLPLLVVTAYRPGDDIEWPPPVDRVLTLKVPIGPLDEHDSNLLVAEVIGHKVPADLARRLYDRSGGNPLFLTELAVLAGAENVSGREPELPGSLRALIASRLDELPMGERAIVDNAAILGTEGSIMALRQFAEAMEQRFDEHHIEDLVASGFFEVEGTWWQFRSDVVREVAYQTLTKQARAQRHAATATVMAGFDKSPLEDVAHHAATAAELLNELGSVPGVRPPIREQAIDYLARAARRAYDNGGYRRGAGMADRALSLAGDDPEVRRPLLLLHATGLVELRVFAQACAELDEAIESARVAGDRVAEGEANRLHGMIEQLGGDLVSARVRLGRAVEIFREIGNDAYLAEALRARGFAEVFGGSLDDAEWHLGESDAVYAKLGDERGQAWVGQHRAWVAFLGGKHALAEQRLAESIATFEALDDHSGVTWSRGLLGFVLYFERRFEEADAIAQDVLVEAKRWGDEWGAAMMLTLGANLRLWTGRFSEAVQYSERALVGFRKLNDRFGLLQALAPLNRARVALGRFDEAERGTEEVLSLADSFGSLAYPTIAAAGVAMHLGQGERAKELALDAVDRLAATGANVDESRVLMSIAQTQSGDPDEALASLVDVAVDGSPFALAARALAEVSIGDDRRAVADADAVAGLSGASYFDRLIAGVAGAVASCRLADPDADERLAQVLADADASGDVVVGGLARAAAFRLHKLDVESEPMLLAGWRRVVDQLVPAAVA